MPNQKGVTHYLNDLEEILLIPLMVVMTVLAFVQVVTRFLLHLPVPWLEELLRFLFIWSSVVGASAGIKRHAHPNLDFVISMFPRPVHRFLQMFGVGCVILFSGLMIWASIGLVLIQAGSGQLSAAMRIPMYFGTLAIPVGFMLLGVRSAQVLITKKFSQ
ncbi:TRAP transporter small permease [Gelria sp. Kuro-4]|uniref:TRAP transporter small permease n=1 Tax=Gelria sp. Kuro-4 TaxID=2796927 RepID=UPI001BEF109A|nr:TRAP transporter small permease [Gelria sp. Kuro-4]BCV24874.1 TRAP transporter small permease protein [Gelria sp. Kuro-4]